MIDTVKFLRKDSRDKLKCACDKKSCAGICREKNLYRKDRKILKRCPAAYQTN